MEQDIKPAPACEPGSFYTAIRSSDPELINGIYRTAHVDWVQVERGPFGGNLTLIDLGILRVFRVECNVGWRRYGDLHPGTSLITFIATEATKARWFGKDATFGHVAVTPNGLDISTVGSSCGYSVTFDTERFRERFPRKSDQPTLVDLCQTIRLQHNPLYAERLRTYVDALFAMVESAPAVIMRPSMRRVIERDLVFLLACTLETGHVETWRAHSLRVAAVRTCETYMLEHIDEAITLQDLSDATGIRSRSVANAFEAVIGMSPMVYLKTKRLGGVRRALLHPDREKLRIMDVAADWGFWHMGHFVAAYRMMYGETPSETLWGLRAVQ